MTQLFGWSAPATVDYLRGPGWRSHEHSKSLKGLAVGPVIAEACFFRSETDSANLARRIQSPFSPMACGAAPVAGARQIPARSQRRIVSGDRSRASAKWPMVKSSTDLPSRQYVILLTH